MEKFTIGREFITACCVVGPLLAGGMLFFIREGIKKLNKIIPHKEIHIKSMAEIDAEADKLRKKYLD